MCRPEAEFTLRCRPTTLWLSRIALNADHVEHMEGLRRVVAHSLRGEPALAHLQCPTRLLRALAALVQGSPGHSR